MTTGLKGSVTPLVKGPWDIGYTGYGGIGPDWKLWDDDGNIGILVVGIGRCLEGVWVFTGKLSLDKYIGFPTLRDLFKGM